MRPRCDVCVEELETYWTRHYAYMAQNVISNCKNVTDGELKTALVGEYEELPLLIGHPCPVIRKIVQTRLTADS